MGNQQSHGRNHTALPVDDPVYAGPKLEYKSTVIKAKIKSRIGMMGMTTRQGQEIVSTNLKNHYKSLDEQYTEYYRLVTFFKIPLQVSAVFTSVRYPFQAIFCRPSVYEPLSESWTLQVQNVQIQFSMFATGRLFSYGSTVGLPANVQGIYDIISAMAQKGARLICMECNGSIYSSGDYTAASYGGFIYGVDVFFEVPQHPNPKLYTYTAHSTPIVVAKTYGAVQVQCDWAGALNMYLQEGWKLVDVLIPNLESGEMEQGDRGMGTRTEQTIWFFEKEASMVNDRTPKYQVTLVEYYIHVSISCMTFKTDFNLRSVLTEMGQKGWELCSVLDTPQTSQTGMGSVSRGIVLFFQRPLLETTGGSLFIQPSSMISGPVAPTQGPPPFGPQGFMGPQVGPPPPANFQSQYQPPPPGYQPQPLTGNLESKQGPPPSYEE